MPSLGWCSVCGACVDFIRGHGLNLEAYYYICMCNGLEDMQMAADQGWQGFSTALALAGLPNPLCSCIALCQITVKSVLKCTSSPAFSLPLSKLLGLARWSAILVLDDSNCDELDEPLHFQQHIPECRCQFGCPNCVCLQPWVVANIACSINLGQSSV